MSSTNSPPSSTPIPRSPSAHKRQPLRVPRASGRSGDRRCSNGLGSSGVWSYEGRAAASARLHGPLAHGPSTSIISASRVWKITIKPSPEHPALVPSKSRRSGATIVGGQQVLERRSRRGWHHPRPRYSVQSAGLIEATVAQFDADLVAIVPASTMVRCSQRSVRSSTGDRSRSMHLEQPPVHTHLRARLNDEDRVGRRRARVRSRRSLHPHRRAGGEALPGRRRPSVPREGYGSLRRPCVHDVRDPDPLVQRRLVHANLSRRPRCRLGSQARLRLRVVSGVDFPGESARHSRTLPLDRCVTHRQLRSGRLGNRRPGHRVVQRSSQWGRSAPAVTTGAELGTKASERVISEQTSDLLMDMMQGVVEHENGTGPNAAVRGYTVSGKTSTAATL